MKRLLTFVAMTVVVLSAQAYKKVSLDINVNGTQRNMIVYTPNTSTENLPLMLVTHGMNQDPEYQFGADKMYELIDTAKFVISYLRGIDKSWDMGDGGKDKNFVLKAIDEMSARYGIDTNRVYWSGFSMGSMFMYAVMGSMTDKIAAFAPCSGMMGDPSGSIRKKVNIIHCHAYGDDVVVYDQFNIRANVTRIANNLGYTNYTKRTNYRTKNGTSWFSGDREQWKNEEGNEIVLYSFNVDFHNPIAENSYEIWNFCKRYSLDPGVPTVKLESPASDQTFTSVDTIDIKAVAKDADGYIANIYLYIDGKLTQTQTFAGRSEDLTYTLEYRWVRPSVSTHTVKVIAEDDEGKKKELSKSVTIGKPAPMVLVSADPEDKSFDLPATMSAFRFTFDWRVRLSKVNSYMTCGEDTVTLTATADLPAEVSEDLSRDLVLKAPDGHRFKDGEWKLFLKNVTDERGVRAQSMLFKYTFGITEVDPEMPNPKSEAEKCKVGFHRAYKRGSALIEKTDDERYAVADMLREPLESLLDEYKDFASTSPTKYQTAIDTLTFATDTLETRVHNLDSLFVVADSAYYLLDLYKDDPTVSASDIYSKLKKATDTYMKPDKLKTYAGIMKSISTILSYIKRFNSTVAVESLRATGTQGGAESVIYDLSGKAADADYHGIIIINGKKYLRR